MFVIHPHVLWCFPVLALPGCSDLWEFVMSPEVTETETRPTHTNAEISETEPRPTDTSAEVAEVGETESRPDLLWNAGARGLCGTWDANFKPHDGVHTEKLRDQPIAATHRYALNLTARQIQKAPALEARASYQGRKMLPLTSMGQHDKRFRSFTANLREIYVISLAVAEPG